MKFHRIYIEITNICGLKCSFCPTSNISSETMPLKLFEDIVAQSKRYTREIALHVMGDPLTLNNLVEYLDILDKYKIKAILTTSGYFIKKQPLSTLFHNAVKQINISLNSYNKNDTSITLLQYLTPIINLCNEKLKQDANLFINLRIWNLDEEMSEESFNQKLFRELSKSFNLKEKIERVYKERPKNIRLENKILLHFDNYFEWPSLDNPIYGNGTCLGLKSHIAILVDGTVVPCCLDSKGVIKLGDLKRSSLDETMNNNRTKSIRDNFTNDIAIEELCQKCSYKSRFNEQSL